MGDMLVGGYILSGVLASGYFYLRSDSTLSLARRMGPSIIKGLTWPVHAVQHFLK